MPHQRLQRFDFSFGDKCNNANSASFNYLILSSIFTHFNTSKKKSRENIVEKGEIARMSNFTFSHNVFYAICILKSFNCHISVVRVVKSGLCGKWL